MATPTHNELPAGTIGQHANAPIGVEYFIDNLYYKIGVHGKPFKHNGLEWTLSSKSVEFIECHSRIDN